MVIVMTGATSGIGAEALKKFMKLPDTTISLPNFSDSFKKMFGVLPSKLFPKA